MQTHKLYCDTLHELSTISPRKGTVVYCAEDGSTNVADGIRFQSGVSPVVALFTGTLTVGTTTFLDSTISGYFVDFALGNLIPITFTYDSILYTIGSFMSTLNFTGTGITSVLLSTQPELPNTAIITLQIDTLPIITMEFISGTWQINNPPNAEPLVYYNYLIANTGNVVTAKIISIQ